MFILWTQNIQKEKETFLGNGDKFTKIRPKWTCHSVTQKADDSENSLDYR